MKKTTLVLFLIGLMLSACGQKIGQTFDAQIWVKQGIRFGDGTIQTTAPTGVGVVTWASITDKPTTFTPSVHNQAWSTITARPTTLSGYGITDAATLTHNHAALYKPLSYIPTWGEILEKPVEQELATAIPQLMGIRLPVLTTVQINALTPVTGLLVFDSTISVLKIYDGTTWKIVIMNN